MPKIPCRSSQIKIFISFFAWQLKKLVIIELFRHFKIYFINKTLHDWFLAYLESFTTHCLDEYSPVIKGSVVFYHQHNTIVSKSITRKNPSHQSKCFNSLLLSLTESEYNSVVFHIEISHLICTANQMTGFYMKWNTELEWINQSPVSFRIYAKKGY